MTSKRVDYYATESSDPIRSLSGPVGFAAGGLVGPAAAKNQNLGIDLSMLSRTSGGEAPITVFNTVELLQVQVPAGECGIVKGIRQYLTIGQSTDNADGSSYVEQIPVETPTWSFQDGYVIWHLSVARGRQKLEGLPNAHSLDGFAGLGTWYDMRFPWGSAPNAVDLGPRVPGPAVIVMWLELLQTDPTTRPLLTPAPAGIQYAATKETNFLQSFTHAIYWRAAGGLIVEFDRAGVTV